MNEKPPNLSILDLPNCILLNLLKYIDSSTLHNISRTCERLRDLVNTSILWRHIDVRAPSSDLEQVEYCVDQVHERTNNLLLRPGTVAGKPSKIELPAEIFHKLAAFENLNIMALENVTLPSEISAGNEFHIKYFPKSLTELSLRQSQVKDPLGFFRFSDEYTYNLKVLILDECDWATTALFMPISKYKKLEVFSIYKCRQLENSVPYLGLAGVCGFRTLKVLDARLTDLGDTLIASLYRSTNIIAMYLQVYNESYKSDRARSKSVQEHNSEELSSQIHLTDKGFFHYSHVSTLPKIPNLPASYLYQDPYEKCDCHYRERARLKRSRSESPEEPPDPKRRRIEDEPGPSRQIFVEINGLFGDIIIQNVLDREVRKVQTPLKRFSARGSDRVTDFALEYMKNVNLDVLDLTYTKVTRRGIEDYLVHNPNCRIIHEKYCFCLPRYNLE